MTDRQFICRMVLPLLGVLVGSSIVMWLGAEIAAYFLSYGGTFVVLGANAGWTTYRRKRCCYD